MSDLVSAPGAVVMAVFRPNPVLFARQIASIKAQTVTDWRCLVGIDGADPATATLARDLISGDDRFEVREYADNVGVYRHFERLLEWVPVAAEWVSLADQDDFWYPDKFERMLPVLGEEGVSAVSGQARLVGADGDSRGVTRRIAGSMADILLRNQVSGALTIFRRSVLDVAARFPEPTAIAIHDHWLGVVAASAGRVVVMESSVQDYVQHGDNVLGEPRQPSVRESWTRVRALGGIWAHADQVTNHRWGWRVAMARRALELPRCSDEFLLREFARGGLAPGIAGLILRALRTGRITVRDAAGLTAASMLWPVIGGSPIARYAGPLATGGQRELSAAIVVPLFEPKDEVVETVARLTEQASVVCVDDGSSLGAEPLLARLEALPGVELIRSGENRGIAAALNLGVRRLLQEGADVVVTFDQDSAPAAGHVARLVAELGRTGPEVGAIGPGLVDGVPVTPRILRSEQPVRVHSLIQSGLAIRGEALARVGSFDESLFIDGVDTDFCLRLDRFGFRVLADPALDLAHGLGGETGEVRRLKLGPFRPVATQHSAHRRYYINRNAILLLRRYALARPGWALAHLRRVVLSDLLALTEPAPIAKSKAALEGLVHGMGGRTGNRQNARRVNDQTSLSPALVTLTSDEVVRTWGGWPRG